MNLIEECRDESASLSAVKTKLELASDEEKRLKGYRRMRLIRMNFELNDSTGFMEPMWCIVTFFNSAKSEAVKHGGLLNCGEFTLRNVWIPVGLRRRDCKIAIELSTELPVPLLAMILPQQEKLKGADYFAASPTTDRLEFRVRRYSKVYDEKLNQQLSAANRNQLGGSVTGKIDGSYNFGVAKVGGSVSTNVNGSRENTHSESVGREISRTEHEETNRLVITQKFD